MCSRWRWLTGSTASGQWTQCRALCQDPGGGQRTGWCSPLTLCLNWRWGFWFQTGRGSKRWSYTHRCWPGGLWEHSFWTFCEEQKKKHFFSIKTMKLERRSASSSYQISIYSSRLCSKLLLWLLNTKWVSFPSHQNEIHWCHFNSFPVDGTTFSISTYWIGRGRMKMFRGLESFVNVYGCVVHTKGLEQCFLFNTLWLL